jgi:hypothetical protein
MLCSREISRFIVSVEDLDVMVFPHAKEVEGIGLTNQPCKRVPVLFLQISTLFSWFSDFISRS